MGRRGATVLIIDLRSKRKQRPTEHVTPKKTEEDLIRAKLSCMSVRNLRQFARDRHISLAGASRKDAILDEIMGQYGHQWGARNG